MLTPNERLTGSSHQKREIYDRLARFRDDPRRTLRLAERRHASKIRGGVCLRRQLGFESFLARCASDPEFTFRGHLRFVGGAIEE